MNRKQPLGNVPFFRKIRSRVEILRKIPKSRLTAKRKANSAMLAALLPLLVFAVWQFGFRIFTLFTVSCAFALLFDFLFGKIMHESGYFGQWDFSSLLFGALLGLLYPVTLPLWIPPIGALLAVGIYRFLPLLRKRFPRVSLSPTAFTVSLLILAFPGMAAFHGISGRAGLLSSVASLDILPNTGDPLAFLKSGALPEGIELSDFLLGTHPGRPGCVSAVLLLCCALFLLLRRDITWHIPAAFVGSVAFITFLFPKVGGRMTDGLLLNERLDFMFGEIFGGGLLFAAIFLAARPDIAPLSAWGRLLFGLGCGIITVLIRYYTPAVDGCFTAVWIMGLLCDPVDRLVLLFRYPREKNGQTEKTS